MAQRRPKRNALAAMLAALSAFAALLGNPLLANPVSAQERAAVPINLHQMYAAVIQYYGSEQLLTAEDDPFKVPEFLLVWHNANLHQDEALAYLQDPDKSNVGKTLITTAMLNLSAIDINAYLKFCTRALDLMQAGKIDAKFVRLLIFFNARIVNLDTPNVVKFLATLETNGIFPDAAAYLLTGRARTQTKNKNWPIPSYVGR